MKSQLLQELKYKAEPVLREHGVPFAGVFGSVARGEDSAHSDIDIMIRVPTDRVFSFVDLIRVEDQLKTVLGRNVDLVTENGMSKYMKPTVLRELKILYE